MSDLPELTLCILTYKRPWYAILTLQAMIGKIAYAGPKKYHIADGGSPAEQIEGYETILKGHNYTISVTDNMGDMVNSCAKAAGDVWWMTTDDFMPFRRFDITPDVRFLLANGDVGAVRMGRLACWETGNPQVIEAQMRPLGGLHWWVFDKQRTTHTYICALATTLYHRRFWDCYGDIPAVPPHIPGIAETEGAKRYNDKKEGPTIAIPMRFGEDCGDWQEPIWHFGMWRTDEYASTAVGGKKQYF